MTTVLTTGVFDLFHRGHLQHLLSCAAMGDQLIVMVDSDARVKQAKGEHRPFIRQAERVAIVRSVRFVTAANVFDFDGDIDRAIRHFGATVLVGSRQYANGGTVIGAETIKALGGTVRFVPELEGVSTSLIIERIRHATD